MKYASFVLALLIAANAQSANYMYATDFTGATWSLYNWSDGPCGDNGWNNSVYLHYSQSLDTCWKRDKNIILICPIQSGKMLKGGVCQHLGAEYFRGDDGSRFEMMKVTHSSHAAAAPQPPAAPVH
jgi:hypothetical protein